MIKSIRMKIVVMLNNLKKRLIFARKQKIIIIITCLLLLILMVTSFILNAFDLTVSDLIFSSPYDVYYESSNNNIDPLQKSCQSIDDYPTLECPFENHQFEFISSSSLVQGNRKYDGDAGGKIKEEIISENKRKRNLVRKHRRPPKKEQYDDVTEAPNHNTPVSLIYEKHWTSDLMINLIGKGPNDAVNNNNDVMVIDKVKEFPFSSLKQWRRYCSDDAPNNCYSSMCFLPSISSKANTSSRQNNNNNDNDDGKNDNNNNNNNNIHIDMPSGVGCQPSPFYRPSRRKEADESKQLMNSNDGGHDEREDAIEDAATIEWNRGRRNDEYTCKARRSQRGEYFVKNAKENAKNDPLFKFKKHTSWAFSKWYDWSGKCVRRGSKSETLELSGKHSKKDGLYHLKNVCLRPNGGIAGFFPPSSSSNDNDNDDFTSVLEPYEGADDVAYVTHQFQQEMSWFLGNSKLHTRLKKPADCYLDTKVILFPVDWRNDNPGHCFYRTGYTLRSIEAAFGKDAMLGKDKVTVGYLRVTTDLSSNIMADKSTNMRTTMMKYYYDVLGTSWFSINGVPVNYTNIGATDEHRRNKVLEELHGFIPQASDLENTYACFKDVVIAQNSRLTLKPKTAYKIGKGVGYGFVEQQTETLANVEVPGAQTSFHIYGYRTARDAETLDILDNRLRECGQLPPRREMVRRKNPHVVFAVRSLFRRLSLQPFLIGHLAKEVARRFGPGASLEVIEHSKLSFKEIIERFSDADVLLGMYGASLMWSLFMPPHAHIVMFNTWSQCWNHVGGVMRDTFTEYSGSAVSRKQYHLTMFDLAQLDRYAAGYNYPGSAAFEQLDVLYGPVHIDLALDTVQCLMLQTLPQAQKLSTLPCAAVPKCCQFHTDHVNEASTRMFKSPLLWDDGVLPMLLHLRLLPKSSPFYSPRLAMLLRDDMARTTFAAATKPFAVPSYPKIDHDVKILVIEPCRYRSSVFAEMSFFRQVFQRVDTLYVAEYAMGEEFCRQHEDAEFERTVRDHSRATYHEGTKIRDYRWDKHFLKTCVYPCREFGPFDLTISDCFVEPKLSAMPSVYHNRYKHCLVNENFFLPPPAGNSSNKKRPVSLRRTIKASRHQIRSTKNKNRNNLLSRRSAALPCATDIFASSSNALFGTLLSFGIEFNSLSSSSSATATEGKEESVAVLRALDTESFRSRKEERKNPTETLPSVSSSATTGEYHHLFATRGQERCRIRPLHPADPEYSQREESSTSAPRKSFSTVSSEVFNGDARFSRITGSDFGFNLMVQQTISNKDAFDPSVGEWTLFTHPNDVLKKSPPLGLYVEVDDEGAKQKPYDMYT